MQYNMLLQYVKINFFKLFHVVLFFYLRKWNVIFFFLLILLILANILCYVMQKGKGVILFVYFERRKIFKLCADMLPNQILWPSVILLVNMRRFKDLRVKNWFCLSILDGCPRGFASNWSMCLSGINWD